MVIAVNTKYFLKAYQHNYSNFIFECFRRIANRQPRHTFIFFSDAAFDSSFYLAGNSIPVVVPVSNGAMLSSVLYNMKVLALLKKYHVNIFLNADAFCSLFTKARQCFIAFNPDYLSESSFSKQNHLFLCKIFAKSSIKKARLIITESQFSRNHIIKHYKTGKKKIDVINNGVSVIDKQIHWEEKEKIKAQYADGNEYFVLSGNTSQPNILVNLLKAFSHFKKWQKSSMRLLIVQKEILHNDFTESLKSFKYRNDVKLLHKLPQSEVIKVTAAAYCMIHSPFYESFTNPPLQAMSYKVPVITSNTGSLHEICAEAVLYANFNNYSDVAEKLILVFKDENLRQDLIEKGIYHIRDFNWDKTSDLLWKSIVKASA